MAVADPCVVIVDIVLAVEPDLDPAAVAEIVTGTLRQRPVQRQVAQILQGDPQLLTSGRPEGPRSIERLIRALQARGATQVALPRCARCGHARPLQGRDGDRRICAQCTARQRAAANPCAVCGNVRLVAHRDRQGRPRCAYCPPEDGDPIDVICAVIDCLGIGLAREPVVEAVVSAAPRAFQQRRLAWALEDNPALLTGHAVHGPLAVVDLIEALIGQGAALTRPPCPFCGKAIRLGYRRDGVRCCRSCRAAARIGICSRCRTQKKITARTLEGQPLCHQCMRQDPINHEPCSRCGQTRPVQIRRDGQAVCSTCYRRPVAVCSICGKTKPCLGASTSTPRCEPCTRRLGSRPDCSCCGKPRLVGGRTADGQPLCDSCARTPEPCTTCGRNRYVQGRTADGAPLCRRCYPKHPVAQRRCTACGDLSRLYHHGLCNSCACAQQLRLVLSDVDGVMRADLEPVFEALNRQPPLTMLAWLRSPRPRALLAGLARGSGQVTHATLDRLAAPARTVAHLRGILVSAGALPQRDEYLAALEQWILKATARITDPDERALVRQFAAWHHLRRLRNRTQRTGPTTYSQADAVRREIRAVVALLAWLRAGGSHLAVCRQADIDTWLTGGSGLRHTARSFLRWAVARRHARAVEIPAPSRDAVPPFIAHDRRWSLLRRLLHDADVDLADRLAGLLVLLFAQPCSRIVRLTTEHVQRDDTHVTLTLGAKPVQLPPPVDDLLTQLVQRRRDAGTEWLFPGAVAGRPFNAEQLSRRLNAIGIRVRAAHNTTMIDLAGDVPAVVLSHLLGLHVRTTTDWVRIAGASSAEYAAEVSRRETFRKR